MTIGFNSSLNYKNSTASRASTEYARPVLPAIPPKFVRHHRMAGHTIVPAPHGRPVRMRSRPPRSPRWASSRVRSPRPNCAPTAATASGRRSTSSDTAGCKSVPNVATLGWRLPSRSYSRQYETDCRTSVRGRPRAAVPKIGTADRTGGVTSGRVPLRVRYRCSDLDSAEDPVPVRSSVPAAVPDHPPRVHTAAGPRTALRTRHLPRLVG